MTWKQKVFANQMVTLIQQKKKKNQMVTPDSTQTSFYKKWFHCVSPLPPGPNSQVTTHFFLVKRLDININKTQYKQRTLQVGHRGQCPGYKPHIRPAIYI